LYFFKNLYYYFVKIILFYKIILMIKKLVFDFFVYKLITNFMLKQNFLIVQLKIM